MISAWRKVWFVINSRVISFRDLQLLCPERPRWQPRYYDFNVYSERKRVEKLSYTHRNPVKRGLAAQPSEWRWSRFNHWAKGKVGTIEIESQWTAILRERGIL